MIRGVDLLVDRQSNFAPLRAGVLNPLTRKIVFVRPSVRPACVCTPFPYCDFATFHFLFGNRRNRRFSNKKYVASLRPTSYLKSDDFGRKYAILRPISYAPRAERGAYPITAVKSRIFVQNRGFPNKK